MTFFFKKKLNGEEDFAARREGRKEAGEKFQKETLIPPFFGNIKQVGDLFIYPIEWLSFQSSYQLLKQFAYSAEELPC